MEKSCLVSFNWHSKNLLFIRYSNIVTGDELVTSALDIASDPRFDHTHFIVADWSDYRRTNISIKDIKTLVAVMKSICKGCPFVKNATVIRRDGTGNALVALYKMLIDETSWEVEIFHECEQAFDWFGVSFNEQPIDEQISQFRQTS